MSRATRFAIVIAVGEPERGDDAVGWRVADALEGARGADPKEAASGEPATALPHLEVRRVRGLEVEHLLAIEPGDRCVIVDAVAGPEAGTVVTLTLGEIAEPEVAAPRGTTTQADAAPGEVASVEGAAPGEVAGQSRAAHGAARPRFAAPPRLSARPRFAARTSHSMPLPEVLALAALIRRNGLPEGAFVGIAGAAFGLGEPLSDQVAAALPGAVSAVLAAADQPAAAAGPAPGPPAATLPGATSEVGRRSALG